MGIMNPTHTWPVYQRTISFNVPFFSVKQGRRMVPVLFMAYKPALIFQPVGVRCSDNSSRCTISRQWPSERTFRR